MDEREYLISAAYKAKGEYSKILQILKKKETVDPVKDGHCLTILDEDYPEELRLLRYPPFVLFYRGDLNLLKKDKIAIIGSRDPGDYAMRATELLSSACGSVVVSGMAKGIDSIAHANAKETIAVLGSGIDVIYPYENRDLYYRLCKSQLVISEYPSGSKPLAYHFPFRNRIIAALGRELYLMESTFKSGSMSTVNEALELSKTIKVLPFSLLDERGLNNNRLIAEGAELIESKDLGLTSDI